MLITPPSTEQMPMAEMSSLNVANKFHDWKTDLDDSEIYAYKILTN